MKCCHALVDLHGARGIQMQYTAAGNQILPGYPVPVNMIEAGSQLACAIDNGFDIDCWGLNVTSNKINHPIGPDFISLSCSNLQCCAVSNTSIECCKSYININRSD